jgi:hypothetical protein
MLACILRFSMDPSYYCIKYDFYCFDDLWLDALIILINVYNALLLILLSILCFLGVEVPEVLFRVEQGWETNRIINYQLINSRGVTGGE